MSHWLSYEGKFIVGKTSNMSDIRERMPTGSESGLITVHVDGDTAWVSARCRDMNEWDVPTILQWFVQSYPNDGSQLMIDIDHEARYKWKIIDDKIERVKGMWE